MQPSPSATSTQPGAHKTAMQPTDPAKTAPVSGRVTSLHLHPDKRGKLMQPVDAWSWSPERASVATSVISPDAIAPRGQPSVRQVSLMEREQIEEHAQASGLSQIPPGAVRARTSRPRAGPGGARGQQIRIGEALLLDL